MLVRPRFEPATSRSVDRRSPNWANQAAVKQKEKEKKKSNVNVPLVMENVIIKQAMETKILRYIIIDQHLSWKCHISLVSTKMLKKTVGIIAKARFYLSFKSLLILLLSSISQPEIL